jgi:DNA-directed RNA polymerase subunit H (RpoH/RPB5)
MTDKEVDTLLNESKLQKKQLPKIGLHDPMIAYFDYPRGSTVRCHRTSNIVGSMISGELPPFPKVVV